jgi:hypothetical protein
VPGSGGGGRPIGAGNGAVVALAGKAVERAPRPQPTDPLFAQVGIESRQPIACQSAYNFHSTKRLRNNQVVSVVFLPQNDLLYQCGLVERVMMSAAKPRIVYIVGAGLSAGLKFPTIGNLLYRMWPKLEAAGLADDIADVIRFHHPDFNCTHEDTFVDVEKFLSEMKANEQLFDSSRPATGNFTTEELQLRRKNFLLEMARWFHKLQATSLKNPPDWLTQLVDQMKQEQAQIISFNWDLILDEMLFGDKLRRKHYGLTNWRTGVRLIKPHGSLNWFEEKNGRHLKAEKKFVLKGKRANRVYAFKPYRAPSSKRRDYLPLIVPPVLNKEFEGRLFQRLWQETVSVLSTASEVRFLGYSLPAADFHARFILRCGFHNQEHGELDANGGRKHATGRAKVTIVDPEPAVAARIEAAVGWSCDYAQGTLEDWLKA